MCIRDRCDPSVTGAVAASSTCTCAVTGTEMSASVSRRVMKAMLVPGRCESWTTWPSTHNPGIRLMYSAILAARCRTGQGAVGVVSIARGTRGRAAVVAVTGAAVTGAAVTGAAVTGAAVTGAAVTGAAVTGAA